MNFKEIKQMNEYLKENQVYETTLEYRGSEHGWSYDDFHKKAGNKGWTVTLFKILHGDCIGGFTTQSWDIKSHGNRDKREVRDDKAFLFNLSCARIFPSTNSGKDIFCSSNFGPAFGGGGVMELSADE